MRNLRFDECIALQKFGRIQHFIGLSSPFCEAHTQCTRLMMLRLVYLRLCLDAIGITLIYVGRFFLTTERKKRERINEWVFG